MKNLACCIALVACASCVTTTASQPTSTRLTEPTAPGVNMDCRSSLCPDRSDVQEALQIFAKVVPGFDPNVPITVEWHGFGEKFEWKTYDGKLHEYYGLTLLGGNVVKVSSYALLEHELFHVQSWRDGKGGNAAHVAWPQTLEDEAKLACRGRGLAP